MRSRLAEERRNELAQEALAMTPGERVAAALALGERAVLDYMENFGVGRDEAMRVLRRAGRAGRRYSKVMDEPADERPDHGRARAGTGPDRIGGMKITNVLAALPVRDLDAAVHWFGELVGAEPTARPMDGLAEWRFPAGGWVQVFADAERAGKGSLTVVVEDIEACRRDLEAKGVAVDSSGDGGTTRITIITDPDGNRIVFAQSEDRERNPSASGVVP